MGTSFSNPDGVHAPVGRYSHLVRTTATEILYLAGQVGVDVDGNLVGEGDIGLQLRQTYKNIGAILESAGASYADIVSVVTYVVGTESLQPYQEARVDLFDEMWPDGRFPPNTLLAINGLARPEMLVEVTATAVVP